MHGDPEANPLRRFCTDELFQLNLQIKIFDQPMDFGRGRVRVATILRRWTSSFLCVACGLSLLFRGLAGDAHAIHFSVFCTVSANFLLRASLFNVRYAILQILLSETRRVFVAFQHFSSVRISSRLPAHCTSPAPCPCVSHDHSRTTVVPYPPQSSSTPLTPHYTVTKFCETLRVCRTTLPSTGWFFAVLLFLVSWPS